MLLNIGGVVIVLDADADGPPPVVDGAARALRRSIGNSRHPRAAANGATCNPVSEGRLLFDSGGLWQQHECGERLVYSFTSPLFPGGPYRQASFDRQFRRGVVTLDRRELRRPRARVPARVPARRADGDQSTRLRTRRRNPRLWRRRGIRRGVSLRGPVGCGKSTIARLWAERRGVRGQRRSGDPAS